MASRLFWAALVGSVTASFRPGAVCEGLDPEVTAAHVLQGKHLVLGEIVWSPYAFKNESSPTNWSGYDLEVLAQVSRLLGFTYEIVELPSPTGGESMLHHLNRPHRCAWYCILG